MIDLTLLGCGGNVPMPNRFLSSLFINYKGRKMLNDWGGRHTSCDEKIQLRI